MPPEADELTRVPDAQVRAGDVLSERYRVERVIGRGGMATVVEATHLELRDRVAIKLLHEGMVSDEGIERFLREARAIFRVRAENVCRVLDVGRLANRRPYIVMEYLEGQDLATAFKNKRCEPDIAAAYVLQACRGLAEAHALGIVHRDLKPANLFLTKRSDGTDLVKVLDFGISKIRSDDEETLTREDQIMGTPRYMAPEQFGASRTADARADIWALGLVLYKLLAGALPYTAISVADIYAELMNQAPKDVRTQVPELDPAFAAVVMKCLERDAPKRFADARELARALEPFARLGTSSRAEAPSQPAEVTNPTASIVDTPGTPPPPNKKAVVVAISVASLASVAALVFFVAHASHQSTAPPPIVIATATAPSAPSAETFTPPPPSSTTIEVPAPPASVATPAHSTHGGHATKAQPRSSSSSGPYSPSLVGKF